MGGVRRTPEGDGERTPEGDGRRTAEGEGWDHVAWRVEGADGAWIVKEAKEATPEERAESAQREAAVMRFVRRSLGGWAAADATVLPGDHLTYRRVEGVALQELLARGAVPAADRARLAVRAGRLVGALARLDPAGVGMPLPVEDDGWDPWFAELGEWLAAIAPVAGERAIAAVEAFASGPRPPAPSRADLAFCHNDLGAEHILVDPADLAVTGVIDWTDAAVADPATEAGRLLRDLGADVLDRVLDGMEGAGGDPAAVAARAWCHARLLAVEDLAYALAHRPSLVPHELATLLALYGVEG